MADQEETVEPQEDAAESGAEQTAAEAAAGDSSAAEAEPAPQVEPAPQTEAEPAPQTEAEPAPQAEAEPAPQAEAAAEPEYTYEVLHKKTVAELRDIAQGIEHEALHGYSTMHKEHLVPALCTALGIEAHVHHEVVGINKDRVKAKIRALKVERQKALEAGDREQLRLARRRIKSLKRKIRRATV